MTCYTLPSTDLIKNARHSIPLEAEDAPDEQSFQQQQDHGHPGADAPAHQCALGQMLGFNVDGLLHTQTEHFYNRVQIWETASNDEWKDGAEGEL